MGWGGVGGWVWVGGYGWVGMGGWVWVDGWVGMGGWVWGMGGWVWVGGYSKLGKDEEYTTSKVKNQKNKEVLDPRIVLHQLQSLRQLRGGAEDVRVLFRGSLRELIEPPALCV